MSTVCKVLTLQGLVQVCIRTCQIQSYCKAGNFGRCNFHINGHKAFRINFHILIFVCLDAQIMPHTLVSHRSFTDVFNRLRADVCGQGSTGSGRASKGWKYWYNDVTLSTPFHVRDYHRTQFKIWPQSNFQMQTFLQFLFLFSEASHKIYEHL